MPPSDAPNGISDEYHWECSDQIDPALQAKEQKWAHEERLKRAQRIAQDELRRRASPTQDATVEAHWQAEYEFWHQLITEEVDRLRWNDGLEPLEVDLYCTGKNQHPAFFGKCRIGKRSFRAIAHWTIDSEGKKILRVHIRPEPK